MSLTVWAAPLTAWDAVEATLEAAGTAPERWEERAMPAEESWCDARWKPTMGPVTAICAPG